MLALIKPDAAPGLRLEHVPVPTPRDGEVLIRVLRTGICGTDMHIYRWDGWARSTIAPPLVTGHEFVGTVVENASDRPLSPGDVVGGESHVCCNACPSCRAGAFHLCDRTSVIGIHRDGAFAEYVALPAGNVWPWAEPVDLDVAAIFDPFGNAVHAALHFDVAGEDVAIAGAGPIGLMAAAVARHAGARSVLVSDVSDYRLELAARLGVPAARTLSGGGGAQPPRFSVGLEMSGSGAGLQELIDQLVPGGRLAALGLTSDRVELDWSAVVTKMLTIQGIFGRRVFETWDEMSRLVREGLDIAPLVTHRFACQDFERAFAAVASRECGKVILDWDGGTRCA